MHLVRSLSCILACRCVSVCTQRSADTARAHRCCIPPPPWIDPLLRRRHCSVPPHSSLSAVRTHLHITATTYQRGSLLSRCVIRCPPPLASAAVIGKRRKIVALLCALRNAATDRHPRAPPTSLKELLRQKRARRCQSVMRYSHSRMLLDMERQQRDDPQGWKARMRHLTWLTLALFGFYFVCTYNVWRYPRPVRHVWIDNVLVEVVEDDWVERARHWFLYGGFGCGALRVLLHCVLCPAASGAPVGNTGTTTTARERMRGDRRRVNTATTHSVSRPSFMKEISTIAVPAWARRRSDGNPPRGTSGAVPVEGSLASAATAAQQTSTFNPTRPMRTEKDLEWFLAYENAQQQQRRSAEAALSGASALRYRDRGGATAPGGGGCVDSGPVDTAECDVINVLYEKPLHQRGRSGTAAPDAFGLYTSSPSSSSLSIPWAELGIFHVEEALQRTREWMSDLCRRLVADVEQCDSWFNEHQIEAYDCHHSLQELLPAPPSQPQPAAMTSVPTMRWGVSAPVPSVAPAPQHETKLAALLREKGHCRQTQQGMQELDTALRYDQRLTLEVRLDVSGTFPSSSASRPSNAELTACREYVIDRLRTFAKQRYLISYNSSGGDVETWRSGFPCDAHLLLHVLRTSVKGLKEYVLFGYQTEPQTHDLALYVGDTGEPYFYVRFRQGSTETLLSTRQGPTSLMEAILAFAAVVHVCYRDVYGGVRSTVNLNEVGLLKVVTEGRRTAWASTRGAS
ncbi:hypothetical protein, conserved [Leishmania tarentolae]|uniref:Uncharacterized protein n=1 Tax=Leishmania tarentolae TaxID=5689 RepID=A0A640K9S6_LEITA|nr:hypothetical protein, conserved [Leishmania tarentolae]